MEVEKANNEYERVKLLMLRYAVSARQFGISLGYKDGKTIDNLKKRGRKIGHTFALRVCSTYPEINYNWIRHGTGEMINASTQTQEVNEGAASYMPSVAEKSTMEMYHAMVQKYMELRDRYDELRNENEMLKRQLKGYRAG